MFARPWKCSFSYDGATLFNREVRQVEFKGGILNYDLNIPGILVLLTHYAECFRGNSTICISGPNGSGKTTFIQNLLAECLCEAGINSEAIFIDSELTFDALLFKKILISKIGKYSRNLTQDLEASLGRLLYLPVGNPCEFLMILRSLEVYLTGRNSIRFLFIDSLTFWPTRSSIGSSNLDPSAIDNLKTCRGLIYELRSRFSLMLIYTMGTPQYHKVPVPMVVNDENKTVNVPLEFLNEQVDLEMVNLGAFSSSAKVMLVRIGLDGSSHALLGGIYKSEILDNSYKNWPPQVQQILDLDFKFEVNEQFKHFTKMEKMNPLVPKFSLKQEPLQHRDTLTLDSKNTGNRGIVYNGSNNIDAKAMWGAAWNIHPTTSNKGGYNNTILFDEIEDTDSELESVEHRLRDSIACNRESRLFDDLRVDTPNLCMQPGCESNVSRMDSWQSEDIWKNSKSVTVKKEPVNDTVMDHDNILDDEMKTVGHPNLNVGIPARNVRNRYACRLALYNIRGHIVSRKAVEYKFVNSYNAVVPRENL
ncbi:bifunctional P-loop containing nucleoside triphosphate hydrolase/AAA+ ATPase domain/DNA repair protein XRCC2 [Babesia duncani]|uniref:Bifunctional P-loop containing nucleoside triphosphate hydrolase/AAA+ ATPase domain/DNA repair protein XRCC2 n=1 Tax=Babesia duncani TaxID=323732 RepID=A0AAD9PNW0_9APIC|nr:bifunctional P-loop containing nucleoside triphosphate hydrolase/AAA+ ATPase domain/DNA repair protein XRCC2 [Babesia duncani]